MKKSVKHKLVFFFLLLLIFGALITRHYGESWDEFQFYQYAGHASDSYSSWFNNGQIIVTGNTYDNYGPAFVIFTSVIATWLHTLYPNELISDLRHYIYFLTFLIGVWAFYDIARRWMSPMAAFSSTLLFLTQPLFWGHSFISPKDMPFMSLFLLSLALGLKMVDADKPISFNSLTSSSKRTLTLPTAVWLVTIFGLFIFTDIFHTLIFNLVQDAKVGHTNIISHIASDLSRVNADIYIQRYFIFFLRARSLLFLLSSVYIFYIYYRHAPFILSNMRVIVFPAIIMGITTSIRILGPLAGLLIAYYALHKKNRETISILTIYAVIAVFTMYLTWPYLWPNPIGRLWESFQVMSQYPWKGQVLFNGTYYASNNLPYSYLPLLLLIQFTEPTWLLFTTGLFALRKSNWALVSVLSWFVLPLFALIVTRSPLYDNTRQILFILPPIFLVCGLGMDSIFKYVTRPTFQKMIVGLLILPGLIAGIRLHPYEYVYYDSLVGNPTGRFELDYWATSYREAANWLNENASANAQVVVGDPDHLAELYVRKDLKVIRAGEFVGNSSNYAVYSTRYKADENLFAEYETVHEIKRDGLIFAVIKKLK